MIFSSVLVNVTTLHLTAPCDHAGTIQHEAGQVRSALLSVDMQLVQISGPCGQMGKMSFQLKTTLQW